VCVCHDMDRTDGFEGEPPSIPMWSNHHHHNNRNNRSIGSVSLPFIFWEPFIILLRQSRIGTVESHTPTRPVNNIYMTPS
jgi:hypothetical protein